MKIIDLLNKIANDEKVPKKVRYNDEIYDTEISNNFSLMIYEATGNMSDDGEVRLFLNDEVEIIEEDEKIEKLNNIPINYADDRKPEEVYEYLRCTINNLANVINISNENLFELIDKVNNLEKNQRNNRLYQ